VHRAVFHQSFGTIYCTVRCAAGHLPTNNCAAEVWTAATTPLQQGTSEKNENDVDPNSPAVFAISVDVEFQIASKRTQIDELLKLDGLIDSFLRNKDNIKRAVGHAKDINCDADFAKFGDDYDSVRESGKSLLGRVARDREV
jgi:hypothetical protein